jgi:hypothetical protein
MSLLFVFLDNVCHSNIKSDRCQLPSIYHINSVMYENVYTWQGAMLLIRKLLRKQMREIEQEHQQ